MAQPSRFFIAHSKAAPSANAPTTIATMLRTIKRRSRDAVKPISDWLAKLMATLEYAMVVRGLRRLFIAWRVAPGAALAALALWRVFPPSMGWDTTNRVLQTVLAAMVSLPLWSGAAEDWSRWDRIKRRQKERVAARLMGVRIS